MHAPSRTLLLCFAVAALAASWPAAARQSVEPANALGLQGIPPPPGSTHGGGRLPVPPGYVPPPHRQSSQPNLAVTGVRFVDGNDNPITVTPGVPFYVEVDWQYDNPTCTNYTVRRIVNNWTNTATPVNYGCGYTGSTFWYQWWGDWIIYKAGTYPVTVTLDSGNVIAESNESDNTFTTNLVVTGSILPQWSLINVEFGRTNLGPGTDVIVGTMDDAFDFTHPWFTGNDSKGRARLIAAAQNTLGPNGSPTNDTHDTGVMGIVLARGANNGDITGLAPDARYVITEILNRIGISGLSLLDPRDAAWILLTNGVEIINMPWSYWIGSTTDSETGEAPITDLLADYLAYASNNVCVAYVNELTNPTIPTAPGAARNVITVGGLEEDLVRAWRYDNFGPTLDGRCKPDILGNSATNTVGPYWDWREGFPATWGYWGNSFAGPFVTGTAVEMLDYAKHHNRNHDHRLIKAMIMNSGVTSLNDAGAPWTNSPTVPLDNQQGTGILNLPRIYSMYSAGQQPTGAAAVPGYDFATIFGTNATPGTNVIGVPNGVISYRLGSPAVSSADLDVTLAWDRHTFWSDLNGNGKIDSADTFYVSTNTEAQANLDLVLFRNGVVVAQSRSKIDTIEHLHLTNLTPGAYELHVENLYVPNALPSEPFGLAWYSSVLWTNLPPKVAFLGPHVSAGTNVTLPFQLLSGQAGNFILQTATNLTPPIAWTTATNATLTQTAPNTFQMQLPLPSAARRFFRINVIP